MSNSKASTSSTDLDHSKTTRAKFFQRWPRLGELYVHFERNGAVIDYSKERKFKKTLDELIKTELNKGSSLDAIRKSFRKSLLATFREIIWKEDEKDSETRVRYLILDELMSYFLDEKLKSHRDIKYYAQRAFQQLRREQLSGLYRRRSCASFEKDKSNCSEDVVQHVESRITFLSEFFHQEQFEMKYFIASELDCLAEQVLGLVKKKNPSNPLLSVTSGRLKKWHTKGFAVNKFDDEATREILDCQCELLEELGFEVDDDSEKDLIDIYEVLESKKGNWQVIVTIFMAVAHRLGVYCVLIGTSELCWRSKGCQVKRDENGWMKKCKYFALDIFDSPYDQHEVVSGTEDYMIEFFTTVIYDTVPSVVCGELRADLIYALDEENMIYHKYQLSDSSDEDDRFSDRDGYYSDSEENCSEDDEPVRFSWFGIRRRKRKTDKIYIDETKFNAKLTAIRREIQAFRARKQLRAQEGEMERLREENRVLKRQIQRKPSKSTKKK